MNSEHALSLRPSDAYFIAGHGTEQMYKDNGTGFSDGFIVPDGCMIIVQQACGETGYTNLTNKFNVLNTLSSLSMDVLLNPDKHMGKFVKLFGPISIFKPGDKCPHFEYFLSACYDDKLNCHTFSGIIDLENFKSSGDHDDVDHIASKVNETRIQTEIEKIEDAFLDQYKYSIYPSYTDVSQKVSNDSLTVTNELIKKYYSRLNKLFTVNITQEELCKKFKGVYYNFVCRAFTNYYEPTGKRIFDDGVVLNSKTTKNLIRLNSAVAPTINIAKNIPEHREKFVRQHERSKILKVIKKRLAETLKQGRKQGVKEWYETYVIPALNSVTEKAPPNATFGGVRKTRRQLKNNKTIKNN